MFCNVGFFHFCSSKFMVILWSLWSSWRLLSYFHDWTQPHFCFKCWSLEITIALTVESVARFVELFIGYNNFFLGLLCNVRLYNCFFSCSVVYKLKWVGSCSLLQWIRFEIFAPEGWNLILVFSIKLSY